MDSKQIVDLLNSLPNTSYKYALSQKPVTLTKEMANALGRDKRQLLRTLSSVVDTIADKLEIKALNIIDIPLKEQLDAWLSASQWELVESDLWHYAVRDGKSFALISFENNAPVVNAVESYDGKCGALIIYERTNNKIPAFAINTWYVDIKRYLDVYYPDRIEKYVYNGDEWLQRTDAIDEAWPIDFTDNNNVPLGIPLIEFCIGESDIADGAVQIQTDINEALIDQMAISRTMGFPQRYVKGRVNPEYLVSGMGGVMFDALGQPLRKQVRTAPGIIAIIDGTDTEFGQLPSTTPDRTLFDILLDLMAQVTSVPTHYLRESQNPPSGVALLQLDSKLNHKVESHQMRLTPPLQQMLQFMVKLFNTYNKSLKTFAIDFAVDIEWYSPEILTIDLQLDIKTKTTAAMVAQVNAGIRSLESAVRTLNPDWDDQQIADEVRRIQEDKQREDSAVIAALGQPQNMPPGFTGNA